MNTSLTAPSQASRFCSANAHLAYDDAQEKMFWEKAREQGATPIPFGVRFPDGSVVEVDPMGCSITTS